MKRKIQILGIVNLTEDSYYAPSRAASREAFMDRVKIRFIMWFSVYVALFLFLKLV